MKELWPGVLVIANTKEQTPFQTTKEMLTKLSARLGSANAIVRHLGPGVVSAPTVVEKMKTLEIPINKRGGANNVKYSISDTRKFLKQSLSNELSISQMAIKAGVTIDIIKYQLYQCHRDLLSNRIKSG